MTTAPPEPLLTLKQVAAHCQVSTRTVRRWIKAGDLSALRLGGQRRVRRRDLEAFLRRAANRR